MATLQKIRNNAGLLVSIIIGLALLAFILGDLMKSGKSLFVESQNEIGEIAGKKISVQLYQSKVDENTENYKRSSGQNSLDQATSERIQDQTWDQLLHEYIMQDELNEVGVGVSGDELFDMVQGNNIDPQIKQIPIFQNKATGQFDRSLVVQFLKNKDLDPTGNAQSSWHAFEQALLQDKLNEKYNELIKQGLYVTSLQAKQESEDKNHKVDFDYVELPYNMTSDSVITYTDSDIEKYYNENKDKYQQDESREIEYVTFPIAATAEDEQQTEKWINDIKPEFAATENAEQFVNLNSDVPFDSKFYSESELPAEIASLFTSPAGTVIGPYKVDNKLNLSKAAKFANIPDSASARHILIRPSETLSADQAKAEADSLLAVIKKGGNFAELAKKYSSDGSAPKGGDLGWLKADQAGPLFDACFLGKKGDLSIVESQLGYSVLEVTNQSKATKKVQIATLVRLIEPSSQTYQDVYAAASKFGGNNRTASAFKNSANNEKLTIKVATVKRDDRRLANFDNPRAMIRWIYKAKAGEVSDVFEFDDLYVIASVTAIHEKGIAPLEEVRADVERAVKNDLKADYLINKFNQALAGANTLQSLSDKLNVPLKEAKNVSFGAYAITGLGYEPDLQAYAEMLPKDKISEPIKGTGGVFVINVTNIQNSDSEAAAKQEKMNMERSLQSRVSYQVFTAIKDAAKVDDRRSNFY